jgi:hypothetical protein
VLQRLCEKIQAAEDKTHPAVAQVVTTALPAVDEAIGGGLSAGAVHEFFGPLAAEGNASNRRTEFSPLCLLVHLAGQAVRLIDGEVIWIGRRCWPNPQFLEQCRLLNRSLFVDAVDEGTRLWATELAMRSPAVAAVIADGEGFKISATRRLQLAAREARGPVLLSRPGWELATPSAAFSRWAVYRRVCESAHPAWTLELLRCKGRQGSPNAKDSVCGPAAQSSRWPLEWNCATLSIAISEAVVDRHAPSSAAPHRLVG